MWLAVSHAYPCLSFSRMKRWTSGVLRELHLLATNPLRKFDLGL